MDTSTNKDIAMRQKMLSVGGKNTIPPQHIVEQQQRLSQTELASQSRKIIPLEHRELCPLCHCPSFIFLQSKYIKNKLHHHHCSALGLHHGTFMCSNCSNKHIILKLRQIKHLKQEIKDKSKTIEPILQKKLIARNTKYYDKKLKSAQYQQRISNIRHLIHETQKDNKLLKANNDKLRIENKERLSNLDRLKPILSTKWEYLIVSQRKELEIQRNKERMSKGICEQISLKKLLQISDFYSMKVLPTMHLSNNNEQRQLSMIQNIAIPSIFKIKNITSFYSDPYNELFRFPLPNINKRHKLRININVNTTYPYFNRSSSSLLKYRSNKYQVPLKTSTKTPKTIKSINKGSSSPLQKYIPRLTNSISSLLTPPGYKGTITEQESKSLPKNLDDLILPPTFFSDDEMDKDEKKSERSREKEVNKISGRGRSHSLDALTVPIISKRLIHEPHIEHGICAALQYIVSFVLHTAKYLNVALLYRMALYRKSSRGGFNMLTFIEDNCKGKYFPLYWCHNGENQDNNNHNILQFEHGLHLLEQNINDLCIKCGVGATRLQYFQFIANLNTLLTHLSTQNKEEKDVEKKKIVMHRDINRIEPFNIINNYDNISREHSTSNSASESTTAINNSESELLLSPQGDSEHDDWDFVDYN